MENVILPLSTDPIWEAIMTGKKPFNFQCLAIQIILMRLTMNLQYDSSPENVLKCATELRAMLEKNASLPSAKRDIEKIFGQPNGGHNATGTA